MKKVLVIMLAMAMFGLTSCFRTTEKQENVENNDTVAQVTDSIGETLTDTTVVLYENVLEMTDSLE